jgi:hypothetical protein
MKPGFHCPIFDHLIDEINALIPPDFFPKKPFPRLQKVEIEPIC